MSHPSRTNTSDSKWINQIQTKHASGASANQLTPLTPH
jgi:hypothetical protein